MCVCVCVCVLKGQALEEMEEQMNKHFSNKPLKKEGIHLCIHYTLCSIQVLCVCVCVCVCA